MKTWEVRKTNMENLARPQFRRSHPGSSSNLLSLVRGTSCRQKFSKHHRSLWFGKAKKIVFAFGLSLWSVIAIERNRKHSQKERSWWSLRNQTSRYLEGANKAVKMMPIVRTQVSRQLINSTLLKWNAECSRSFWASIACLTRIKNWGNLRETLKPPEAATKARVNMRELVAQLNCGLKRFHPSNIQICARSQAQRSQGSPNRCLTRQESPVSINRDAAW